MKESMKGFLDVKKKGKKSEERSGSRTACPNSKAWNLRAKWIVSGPPEQQGLKKNRVLPYVDLKSRGSPSADGLDEVRRDTVFSE
jgi:hypothetical protein